MNGWDTGGSSRLLCSSATPGAGANGPDEPPPVAGEGLAAFGGEGLYKASTTTGMPFIELGLSDFSMEWLIRGRSGASTADDAGLAVNSGLLRADDAGTVYTGLTIDEFLTTRVTVDCDWVAATVSTQITISGSAWVHFAISADRSGNLTIYVDGAVDSTAAIGAASAESLVSAPVHPLCGGDQTLAEHDSLDDSDADINTPTTFLSAMAIHSRQLTAAEATANAAALIVGQYPETMVRYHFGRFVDASGNPVVPAKDTTAANISVFPKNQLPSPWSTELYAPVAAPGTLFIEDASGRGRHWPLATKLAYGSGALADRAQCGFADTGAS